MADALFHGVGVALLTQFDGAGEIDVKATATHAEKLVEEGVAGVVVAGTTGEASALSARERIQLVEAVRAALPSTTPVIAGVGAPTSRQAVEYASDARRHGADGLLVLAPPGSRDLHGYYSAVAGVAAGAPVLGYHFPQVSAPGIPVDVLDDLPIRAVKDSSGDPERLLTELTMTNIPVYVGSAAILVMAGTLGCRGGILALANLEPGLCAQAFAGHATAQRALSVPHRSFTDHGLVEFKRRVADKYGTSPVVRL